MASSPGNEIGLNIMVKKRLMLLHVYLVKEVARTTIDDQGKFAWRQQVHQVNDRILFPVFGLFSIRAKPCAESPVAREGADIHPATHTARRPEDVLMAKSQVKCTVATHAQAGNRSAFSVSNGFVVVVHPRHQLV